MVSPAEVFVPGGFPERTYVDRPDLELAFRRSLAEQGMLMIISGPSKSGKTVFTKRCLERTDHIMISGDEIEDVRALWVEVARRARIPVSQERGRESRSTQGEEVALEGGVTLLGVGGKRSKTASRDSQGVESSSSKWETSIQQTRELLKKQSMALVIDDFHFVDPSVQKPLLRNMKKALNDGVRIILIAVSHHSEDVEAAERDLVGRVRHVKLPEWGVDDLEQIARKGFGALEVDDASRITDALVDNSFFSPHLMQRLCLEACYEVDLDSFRPARSEIAIDSPERLLRRIRFKTYEDLLQRLARGPNGQRDRRTYRLRENNEVDIYMVLVRALARTGALPRQSVDDLHEAIREMTIGSRPTRSELTRALGQLDNIARKALSGDPALEFDAHAETVYISDPYLAYSLKWHANAEG